MKIRPIREEETPELLALLKAKAEFDGAADSFLANVNTLHEALFSPQPLFKALVAISSDKLVGMLTYYNTFSSFQVKLCLWMDDLFVYEFYRSQGIGKALVREHCSIAHEKGCARINWTVGVNNTKGKDFYQSLGATIIEGTRLVSLDARVIESFVSTSDPKARRGHRPRPTNQRLK